jgi:hypothetical protein
MTYKNGDVFQGEFDDSKINGFGVMKYSDNSIYKGDFTDDERDGIGQLQSRLGRSYKGQWSWCGFIYVTFIILYTNFFVFLYTIISDMRNGKGYQEYLFFNSTTSAYMVDAYDGKLIFHSLCYN